MQKWEYTVLAFTGTAVVVQDKLNQLGTEGWELVSASDGRYHLKRPITGEQFKEGIELC